MAPKDALSGHLCADSGRLRYAPAAAHQALMAHSLAAARARSWSLRAMLGWVKRSVIAFPGRKALLRAVRPGKCVTADPVEAMKALPLSSASIYISHWISKEDRMRLPAQQEALRRQGGQTTVTTIGREQFQLTASQGTGGALGKVAISWVSHNGDGPLRAYAAALCAGLDHGVPLAELLRPGLGLRFAPDGRTDDPEIPAASSPVDYCCRRLAIDWLPHPERAALGVTTPAERAHHAPTRSQAVRPHLVFNPNPGRS
jgi:hypothetical protein